MTKKKLISLFTAAVLTTGAVASLTACGDPEPEVTGISITTAPTTTKYIAGQTFDPTGMVVSKVYEDETTEAIPATEYTLTPSASTALKVSDKEVTVKWTSETEVEYTAKQKITVTNDIAKVEVVSEPNKTEYLCNELFDPTGMVIEAFLEDGTSDGQVEVNSTNTTYKTTGLGVNDSHFEMTYGGFTFYYDMEVAYGAALEAEVGLIISSGVSVADDAPTVSAIEKDYVDHPDSPANGGAPRGINAGNERVNMKYYVHDHLDWTDSTGGEEAGSGRMLKNYLEYSGSKNGTVLYSLTSAADGYADVIIKMSNPNISGSVATEIALNQVLEISVGGQKQTIGNDVVLKGVDWTEYKSYDRASKTYTGASCEPKFAWQTVTVRIPVQQGGNGIEIKSISDRTVRIDSVNFKAEASLNVDSAFAPTVTSAQLKVEGEKVLLGIIVDAKSLGYDDGTVMGVLGNTVLKAGGNLSSPYNVEHGRDPWTQSTDNGGLGYPSNSPSGSATGGQSMSFGNYLGARSVEKVEKITEGDYAGMYYVWYDATIPVDTKYGTTPDKNRYLGCWYISNLSYGAEYVSHKSVNAVLKTDEGVTAELGGYCYQVYCDNRNLSQNEFGEGYLSIIIQDGSFSGDNARGLVARRYLPDITSDNDEDLKALRT